jgi:hypothetical protein
VFADAAITLRRIPSASVAPATTGRPGRRRGGQINYERVELAVRAGVERDLEALLQLLGQQAPFGGRGAQPLGHVLAVAIGSAERIPSRHTISVARRMFIDPRLSGVRSGAGPGLSGSPNLKGPAAAVGRIASFPPAQAVRDRVGPPS